MSAPITKLSGILIAGLLLSCSSNPAQIDQVGTTSRIAAQSSTSDDATGLDSVSSVLRLEDGVYRAGFVIDSDGENHPTVEWTPHQGDGQQWPFERTIFSMFSAGEDVLVSDADGRVFTRHDKGWLPAGFQLRPKSTVLRVEPSLVACTTPVVFMASRETPTCYSVTDGWSHTYPTRIDQTKDLRKLSCSARKARS